MKFIQGIRLNICYEDIKEERVVYRDETVYLKYEVQYLTDNERQLDRRRGMDGVLIPFYFEYTN